MVSYHPPEARKVRVQRDVEEGREEVNEPQESAEIVRKGEMPPWYYVALQPRARLSPAEREVLIRGLEATFEGADGAEHEEHEEREED